MIHDHVVRLGWLMALFVDVMLKFKTGHVGEKKSNVAFKSKKQFHTEERRGTLYFNKLFESSCWQKSGLSKAV